MSNIIDSIQLSGSSYDVRDKSATTVVEITQSEYDNLPASAKTSNILYIITDGNDYYITSAQCQTQIDNSISGKQDTLSAGTGIDITDNVISATGGGGGITSGEVQSMIDESISGKTDESAFTAHTADTTIHVTSTEKATWDAKSDFSGSYNDLTNKLSAGTNITIVDNVISAEGGGKAISAGTNISVTTGETADTINCTLNISNGTGGMSIKSLGATSASANHAAAFGQNTKATKVCAFAEGWGTTASGAKSHSEGDQTNAKGGQSHAEGSLTYAIADHSHSEGYASSATSRVTTMVGITTPYGWNVRHSEGYSTIADNGCTHTEGLSTKALNVAEHSSGAYNVSYTASTTWGDSGNTLFSVGNGTADNARHNAFEIRQNGDIYITKDGSDVKLQDQLGGGGGITSGEVQTMIDESISGKTDESAFTAHTADTTIHVTSTEKAAWNAKSDFSGSYNDLTNKLSAGTNVTIVDNVISAEGGGSITIDPSLDTGSTNAVANSAITTAINAVSGAVPTQYVKKIVQNSDNGVIRFYDVWKESGYAFHIYNFSINGKMVLSKQNGTYPDVYNFNLVETSAITTAVTSSSTDAEVPSAKCLYDTIGNIETLLSQI